MEAKIKVDINESKDVTISNNTIKEHQTISEDEKGINDPGVVIPIARKINSINKVSEENTSIYEKYLKHRKIE